MHCMRSQWKTRRIEITISLQLFFMLLHDHDFSDPALNTFIARGRNQTHAINNNNPSVLVRLRDSNFQRRNQRIQGTNNNDSWIQNPPTN